MEAKIVDEALAQMRRALEGDDWNTAEAILQSLRPADRADVFSELEPEDQDELLPRLDVAHLADILEEMEETEAAALATRLDTEALARVLDEMEPDEAADLLGDLPQHQAAQALREMADSDEVRPLLIHPDDSAGGLMTSEFLALRRRMTAGEAIAALRQWAPDDKTVYYLFVVDREKRLCGVVSLRQLVIADPNTPVGEIMDSEVIHVHVGVDQEECAQLMARYDLLALPVVDDAGQLVGIITVDDVVDVMEDEATEDILHMGAVQAMDEPYLSANVFTVARKRIGWLLLLFVTEAFTGTVLRHFERELSEVVALAFFVPLLIGTGGNAGSQTTSTIIRALAVGEVDLTDFLRVVWHETRTGLMLGLAMAGMTFIRALTWGAPPLFGTTVALSIFTIVLWAATTGAALPLIAHKLGIDPTVVSGPLMSTLVDATGLFIYFTIAKSLLGL